MKIEEGDIVIAPFRYMENEEKKLRPCLVWEINPVAVTLVYITSQKLDKAFDTEVVLSDQDAEAIGLKMASRIDFNKTDECLIVDVVKVVGRISSLPRPKLSECFSSVKAARLDE